MPNVVDLPGSDVERFRSASCVVLPVGSIEYHGPHATLGTDTTLAQGFADRLASALDALVLPVVPYTFTPSITQRFAGTLSVRPTVLIDYLVDILRSVRHAGAKRVLVLNGHSENQYSVRLAAETVAEADRDVSILAVNWWKLADIPEGTSSSFFRDHGGHGHGGPLEISVASAFSATGVRPQKAEDIAYEAPWWRGAAQVVGRGQAPTGFAGYHGNVSEIDPARGSELVDLIVERMTKLVQDWLHRAE